MDIEKLREEFEKYLMSIYMHRHAAMKRANGDYIDFNVRDIWQGFQAHAALQKSYWDSKDKHASYLEDLVVDYRAKYIAALDEIAALQEAKLASVDDIQNKVNRVMAQVRLVALSYVSACGDEDELKRADYEREYLRNMIVDIAKPEAAAVPNNLIEQIIADYKEHYDFPCQGESHMRDVLSSFLVSDSDAVPMNDGLPQGWTLLINCFDERTWINVIDQNGNTASLSCASRNDNGLTIQAQILCNFRDALLAANGEVKK